MLQIKLINQYLLKMTFNNTYRQAQGERTVRIPHKNNSHPDPKLGRSMSGLYTVF